jgi:hypothetical protein
VARPGDLPFSVFPQILSGVVDAHHATITADNQGHRDRHAHALAVRAGATVDEQQADRRDDPAGYD